MLDQFFADATQTRLRKTLADSASQMHERHDDPRSIKLPVRHLINGGLLRLTRQSNICKLPFGYVSHAQAG